MTTGSRNTSAVAAIQASDGGIVRPATFASVRMRAHRWQIPGVEWNTV